MADVKRFNSKNGIENGAQESNLSMSDILISQHITGDNNDYKLTLAQAQAIPYGVCESLGDEDKTVNLVNYPSTYTAQVGNKVLIKFIHANTKGHVSDNTYPTLTVGGVTKPIAAQGKTIGAGAIVDDQIIELVLTPDYWNIDQNIREVTNAYTILTDGSYIYNKTQIDANNYTKAQTDSAINGALANLDTLKIDTTQTDVNNCIPLSGQTKVYQVLAGGSNLPIAGHGIIEVKRLTNTHCQQQCTVVSGSVGALKINTYQRDSLYTNNVWNFSEWEKLATESDLSNYGESITLTSGDTNLTINNYTCIKQGKTITVNIDFTLSAQVNAYSSIIKGVPNPSFTMGAFQIYQDVTSPSLTIGYMRNYGNEILTRSNLSAGKYYLEGVYNIA